MPYTTPLMAWEAVPPLPSASCVGDPLSSNGERGTRCKAIACWIATLLAATVARLPRPLSAGSPYPPASAWYPWAAGRGNTHLPSEPGNNQYPFTSPRMGRGVAGRVHAQRVDEQQGDGRTALVYWPTRPTPPTHSPFVLPLPLSRFRAIVPPLARRAASATVGSHDADRRGECRA